MPLEVKKLNEDVNVIKESDCFETPKHAVPMLSQYLPKNAKIWESACGNGRLVSHLKEFGHTVSVNTDLAMGELFNYFNQYHDSQQWQNLYDIEVTNIPFSLQVKWIERALARGKPFALIVPYKSMEIRMSELTDQYGCQQLVPYARLDFITPHEGWYRCERKIPVHNKTEWVKETCGYKQAEKFEYCPQCKGHENIKPMKSVPQIKTMWYTWGLDLPKDYILYDNRKDIETYGR